MPIPNSSKKERKTKREKEREKEEEWRKRGLLHDGPPYTDATRASKYKGARGSDASPRLCVRLYFAVNLLCYASVSRIHR